jgi:four helix bundle protein
LDVGRIALMSVVRIHRFIIRSMMPYQKLTAWQAAHELALAIYRVTDRFPKHELYGLTSQIRRAAFSVAANIAEGVAKRGNGEFRRFLDMSIGSLSEISYATLLAKDLGLLDAEQAKEIESRREHASKLTWGLYKSVSRNATKRSAAA